MTYLSVVIHKEKVHWKRMRTVMGEFKGVIAKFFGILVIIALCISHYAFMGMHTLYETALYFFNRPAFRANLFKLQASLVIPDKKI